MFARSAVSSGLLPFDSEGHHDLGVWPGFLRLAATVEGNSEVPATAIRAYGTTPCVHKRAESVRPLVLQLRDLKLKRFLEIIGVVCDQGTRNG